MFATLHTLTGVPGPLEEGWAHELAAATRVAGPVAGVLVGRRFALGEGTLLALWPTAADADRARSALAGRPPTTSGSELVLGEGERFEVTARRAGSAGDDTTPRYVQLTSFRGPRDEAWVRATDAADEQRIWPALRDQPGLLGALVLQASDGGRVVAGLSESVEACEETSRRVMSTQLLPWEDPALLTGPDQVDIQRLLVADLPAEVTA